MNALVFDDDLIAELDRSVGAAGRNALLSELADWTEKIGDRLDLLIGAGDLKGARQEAHLLRNATARVGAFRLIDCLVEVELYAGVQLTEAVFASKLAGAVEEFVQHARLFAGQSFAINSHTTVAVISPPP
ncbi:hypothetical protein GCM10008023_17330 [Sphingomonas glacialis]|uniref:Hpt domain-containing protein n=1 Tax=Sphingomonas glacialis TaxID=658225 RepID=A0ABQ3LGS8_9SPHN|nr:hypothetical protein [Sphingomonas glacialis]GHH15011.1 hypothetical protein GCM10008023_17330 [Sphingomonas glacialis]